MKRKPKDELFIKLVCNWLKENPNSSKNQVIAEAAFELDVSTVTASRYLKKHTAQNASFERRGYRIICKACEKGKVIQGKFS